jgi:hypothetical protein
MLNKANEYYDTQLSKISKYIDTESNLDYAFSENEDKIVEIYVDGKLKLKAEYGVIGVYNIPMSIWYWGWNIAFINKNLIELLDIIRKFSGDLLDDPKKFQNKEAEELHYLVSNGNFYISSKNIEKIIKLSLYLTKSLWIFPVKYDAEYDNKSPEEMNKMTYIGITKILQYV